MIDDDGLLTEAIDAGLFDAWGLGSSRKDSLYIGESPYGAECAQLGTDGYAVNARRECQAFIGQIRRHYGDEPAGGRLFVKSNPHDFGTYYSVEVEFSTPVSEAYAFAIESDIKGVLEVWDEDATHELERGIHERSQE
jgi:hypothetical protein